MKVVLFHAGRWLFFSQPFCVLQTHRLEDVLPLFLKAERSGHFVAGFISYEAAPAFDCAMQTRTETMFPLLCLGLFPPPEVLDCLEKRGDYQLGSFVPSISKSEFKAGIAAIKEEISAGATYQVNYTYRLNATFSGDAWSFFCDLIDGQKAEHAAFVETDVFSICSASPELFFSLKDGRLSACPMKGTAPRGRTLAEDWTQAEALQNSEKDRAENIMIVDMIRNDMGRVATAGSVKTLSTYDVEKYPTVWQMTSSVQGKMRGGAVDAMTALFPCASITGAPKIKTMEIIQQLETAPRKIYTGSIGFITPQKEAYFNVAIRTALIDRSSQTLEFGVGGGIIWDSDADAEYEETLTKARVLTQPRPTFQLLETLLWEPDGGFFLLDEHLQRLGKSAAYFDFKVDLYALRQQLEDQSYSVPHRVRLLVAKSGDIKLEHFPLTSVQPKRVALAKNPVDPNDIFLFHKTTHREIYEMAKNDFPDADDVILWNPQGEITESCMANVVIKRNDRWVTPPIECGLLGGTYRAYLLKIGKITEAKIDRTDLEASNEIYLINSVRRWCKVEGRG